MSVNSKHIATFLLGAAALKEHMTGAEKMMNDLFDKKENTTV